jgi:hypothetical protein
MIQSSKRLKTLLVVSLLLNVFLIGGVVGGHYRWGGNQWLWVPGHWRRTLG